MQFVTRIAPSPTGDMHLGTARTALFNYLAAKGSNGKFILRIDDTDEARNRPEYEAVIHETMKWLGLTPDILFKQSERWGIYADFAKRLVGNNLAVTLENGAVAIAWLDGMPVTWHDDIAGDMLVSGTNIEQIDRRVILLKGGDKLGQATYQFASVVDDWLSGVNYVIRGKDHISNTPKQMAIWWALNQLSIKGGGEPRAFPQFAHLGLIFKDKKKLSKRDGAASMLTYIKEGYSADAMFNYMLRLGWGFKNGKEPGLLPRERAIGMFLTEGRMRNSDPNFDGAKLRWFDSMAKAGHA